ncbi:Periplasmic serine protease [Roseobacter sp. SK209-2-6]|uniref:S49 family peptidase n=1 Tax=Roseobacter sp. SK209-2-6 TaxID=388739 RepID=UPI0000F3C52C|nr:S49 family peptidase [Roseobacter sp. SK209-2-6]EBA18392.1 Periplasmic serine protease [Roseobacter sp. SK209-2-6]
MPHEIERVLQSVASGVWLIDPEKAAEIVSVLSLRAHGLPSDWAEDARSKPVYAMEPIQGRRGTVHLLRLHGTIMPRGGMMARMSGGASLEMFQKAFSQAASDAHAQAIVIEVDSPGGMVEQVQETASMIYSARRSGRPIVAVANSLAASAAYWIASAADELVVTPSGRVGSIGVYTMHDNLAVALEKAGIERSVISAGARKVESLPFGKLAPEARAATQAQVDATYERFTHDVAEFRGVASEVVRADPEEAEAHFGGGRAYHAQEAVRLGMADRVATLSETIQRLSTEGRVPKPSVARARLNLAG